MMNLLSCHYNMDTDRVEASTASPWRTSTATPRHSGQSWIGCCTINPGSMHRWYLERRWSAICRWDVSIAG